MEVHVRRRRAGEGLRRLWRRKRGWVGREVLTWEGKGGLGVGGEEGKNAGGRERERER